MYCKMENSTHSLRIGRSLLSQFIINAIFVVSFSVQQHSKRYALPFIEYKEKKEREAKEREARGEPPPPPHMIHVVKRIKSLNRRPWWEKEIIVELGLEELVTIVALKLHPFFQATIYDCILMV